VAKQVTLEDLPVWTPISRLVPSNAVQIANLVPRFSNELKSTWCWRDDYRERSHLRGAKPQVVPSRRAVRKPKRLAERADLQAVVDLTSRAMV
jgi:hypothetical protein